MKKKYIQTEEQKEIKKFLIIVLVLSIILLGIYFITDRFVEKADYSNVIPGTINYDKATVGTMLNRSEADYYVIIFDSKDKSASYYSSLINKYRNNEQSIKIYFVDLDNELNAKYYNTNMDNKSNPHAKSLEELDLMDLTLIRVKNNSISSYVEDIETIEKLLK